MKPALRVLLLSPAFNPLHLFRSGAQGWWYDPSDFSTMYQDSTGVTPVTAVEQPVGLQLDKRYGLALGAEFNPDPSITSLTNYPVEGAPTTREIDANGDLRIVSPGVNNGAKLSLAGLTAGVMYKAEIELHVVSGTAKIQVDYATGISPGATGGFVTKQFVFTGGAELYLVTQAEPTEVIYRRISIKPIPGNHRLQGTAAARPTLKALGAYYAQLLDGVDDSQATTTGGGASTAAFIQVAFRATQAGAAQTLWSDRTGNTGLKLEITAANALTFSGGNGASINTATGDTVSVDTDYVATAIYDGGVLSVQLNSAAPVTAACALSAGTAAVTMGKDNGAASGFFKGYLYGSVYVKDAAVSSSLVAQGRRWLGRKAGLSL